MIDDFFINGLNGDKYCLDIDAITKWCLSSTINPSKETEINEGYDTDDNGDFHMTSKVVRELKTNNVQDDTIRYDFIKMIISPFLSDIKCVSEITDNFSYSLMFNTLLNMNFLIKIND
jgi:hypothetical protein